MAWTLAGRPQRMMVATSVDGKFHLGTMLASYLRMLASERPSRTLGSGSSVHLPENSCMDQLQTLAYVIAHLGKEAHSAGGLNKPWNFLDKFCPNLSHLSCSIFLLSSITGKNLVLHEVKAPTPVTI